MHLFGLSVMASLRIAEGCSLGLHNPPMEDQRELGIGSITMRRHGILHTVFDFDGSSSKELAAEYLSARQEMAGPTPPPVLIELIKMPYTDRSIRTFFMDSLPPPPCRAVVATDPTVVALFRTFQLVDDAPVPTQIFSTIDTAVDWIHTQMSTVDSRTESR